MKRLFRYARYAKWLIVAAFSLGLITGCDALRATPAPTPTLTLVSISADQAAQAMENDEFFSDYRNDLLQVSGTVTAVTQLNGQTAVELETRIPRIVRCYLDAPSTAPQVGASVVVQSSEGQREDDAVGLLHCRLIGP